jgi:hypothetical protein
MKTQRKTTCNKCKSVNINITWEYDKKDEMSMYLGHDGWGFQFEDAKMTCAKCGSKNLSNFEYDNKGRIIKDD